MEQQKVRCRRMEIGDLVSRLNRLRQNSWGRKDHTSGAKVRTGSSLRDLDHLLPFSQR